MNADSRGWKRKHDEEGDGIPHLALDPQPLLLSAFMRVHPRFSPPPRPFAISAPLRSKNPLSVTSSFLPPSVVKNLPIRKILSRQFTPVSTETAKPPSCPCGSRPPISTPGSGSYSTQPAETTRPAMPPTAPPHTRPPASTPLPTFKNFFPPAKFSLRPPPYRCSLPTKPMNAQKERLSDTVVKAAPREILDKSQSPK